MCFGMGCPYEWKDGPNVGVCTIHSNFYPSDAACVDLRIDCDECDNGAFTECDGHCLED
jgi:hypothetical protein